MSLDSRAGVTDSVRLADEPEPPGTAAFAPAPRPPYSPPTLEALGSWRALTLFQGGQELSIGA